MITEWFIQLGMGFAQWFVGLVPADAIAVPDVVADLDTQVNGFISGFGSLGAWVPWVVVLSCAGIAIAIWGALWLVKGIAWIWGQIPVIGGSG